jgi:DNA primase
MPGRDAASGPAWAGTTSDMAEINAVAAAYFGTQLRRSWVPGYLASRGFGPDVQHQWQAGYAPPGWDTLGRYLMSLGFPSGLLQAAGLAKVSPRGTHIDVFRNRAMLPVRTADGTVAGFIGRAHDRSGRDVPRYLNSPRTALYDKGRVLFGLWEARPALQRGARPVVVEGPLDAIAVTTSCRQRYAGVALCGTALTSGHVAALDRSADADAAPIVIAFDADAAGQRAAARAYGIVGPRAIGTFAADLPPGQDPAGVFGNHGPDALLALLDGTTRPLAELVIDAELSRWDRWLPFAEGKLNALRAVAPIVAGMAPGQVPQQVARLAQVLGLDHATVTRAVTEALPEVIRHRDVNAV